MPEKKKRPSFRIDSVPIYGDLVLAPMAGFCDLPFRLLCHEMGSAVSYTPCVLAEVVLQSAKRTRRIVDFRDEERPVGIQLLSKDADTLVQAALRLLPLQPDFFDLNLGCPARRVSGRGRGAALLKAPETIGQLLESMVAALPVPVTAKIRLGWDEDTRNYLEVARIIEQSGAAAIAVHGRTRAQGYSGTADWAAIREVKEALRIPVLANGDVRTVADIETIRALTGCDAVMIGRGALGNPWIFNRRDVADVDYDERLAMIRRHLEAMLSYYGRDRGLVLFRKHVMRYIQGLPGATELRPRLGLSPTPEELMRILECWQPLPAHSHSRTTTLVGTDDDQGALSGDSAKLH